MFSLRNYEIPIGAIGLSGVTGNAGRWRRGEFGGEEEGRVYRDRASYLDVDPISFEDYEGLRRAPRRRDDLPRMR